MTAPGGHDPSMGSAKNCYCQGQRSKPRPREILQGFQVKQLLPKSVAIPNTNAVSRQIMLGRYGSQRFQRRLFKD